MCVYFVPFIFGKYFHYVIGRCRGVMASVLGFRVEQSGLLDMKLKTAVSPRFSATSNPLEVLVLIGNPLIVA